MGNTGSNNRRHNTTTSHHHQPPSQPQPPPQPIATNQYIFAAPPPYPNPNFLTPPHYFPSYHTPLPPPPNYPPPPPPSLPAPPPNSFHRCPFAAQPQPLVEHQKAVTIRNDVNVRRETVRVFEDEENPGSFLVGFSLDATTPGRYI